MDRRIAFLLLLGAIAPQLQGAEIFRWVDENGRVHYGNAVPEAYKQKASKTDLNVVNPTDAERREAEARAAAEKNKVNSAAPRQQSPNASPPGPAPQSKPVNTSDNSSACKEQWERYWKSQECFAPYVTKNGIKPEAYKYCTEVPQPTRCVPEHPLPQEPARSNPPPSPPR